MQQEIGDERAHHVERAVGEIDDVEHAEDDGEAEAQQRVERAVDQPDQQLPVELLGGDGVAEESSPHAPVAAGRRWSHAESHMQLLHVVGVEVGIGEADGDAAVLHDVVAVGDRRGEAEVLLDQQNGETLALELGDGAGRSGG